MIKNNVIYREFNERHINVMEITEKIITRNNNTLKIIALTYTAENGFNTLKFFGKKKFRLINIRWYPIYQTRY